MVWGYSLPQIEGRRSYDGVVSGRVVDHEERYILSDLLEIVTHSYSQSDDTKGEYPRPSKANDRSISWN